MLRTIFISTALMLTACGSIDKTKEIAQLTDQELIAGKGDTILKVDRYRNLENAFGKADIFGRKTNEGYTEIRFIETQNNGVVVLARKDVTILTNETTMSRNPFSTSTSTTQTNIEGQINHTHTGSSFEAEAKSVTSTTQMTPLEDYHTMLPPDFIPIAVSPEESIIPVAGYLIEFISKKPNSIRYKITKNH
ncbi:hypothetical protein [Alteromonas macleodii]|uniref:hypothetical protein n=1 Tax=Alteromonas macleodii TaxID=28108 RepID=UPI0031400ED7